MNLIRTQPATLDLSGPSNGRKTHVRLRAPITCQQKVTLSFIIQFLVSNKIGVVICQKFELPTVDQLVKTDVGSTDGQ